MFAFIKNHAVAISATIAAVAAVATGVYYFCHKTAEVVSAATE